jgi:hypothetical protein
VYNLGAIPTFSRCTIVANESLGDGGGLMDDGSTLGLYDCLLAQNTAAGRGGGFYSRNTLFYQGPTEFVSCTIADNTAPEGGGAYNDGVTLTVANTILWGNAPDAFGDDGETSFVSFCDVQGGWPGEANMSADPLFTAPGAGIYRLQPGSPCIDAGNNFLVPGTEPLDLDGAARFVDAPATPDTGVGTPPLVDIGALEFQGACAADVTGPVPGLADGTVDALDMLALLAEWGSPCAGACEADLTGPLGVPDGNVDALDFLLLITQWGLCGGR